MTREERENALHCLKVMIDEALCEECKLYGTTGTDHCEADSVRVAIKALDQESKIEKEIREEIKRLSTYRVCTDTTDLVSLNAVERVLNLVFRGCRDKESKKGRWIKISPAGIYYCSECGQNLMTSDICVYKYCHGCGARMTEESEDAE